MGNVKKRILLSAMTTSILFAGGDVEPIAPLIPKKSVDFYGNVGLYYQFQDQGSFDFGDKENNAFSATITLAAEGNIFENLGFGVEVAGWSDFGLDIADGVRVESPDQTDAEISRAYLKYLIGDTTIKAGRQVLSKADSPWLWTDRSAGVTDWTYDGVVITNKTLTDTTLTGAYIARSFHNNYEDYHMSDGSGLFMIGLINRSLSDTVIRANAYYLPDSEMNSLWNSTISSKDDTWSIWASSESKYETFSWGIQGVYVDGDVSNWDATYGIAPKIGSVWGNLSGELVGAYINDGDYSMRMAGSGLEDGGFWTDHEISADTYGADQWTLYAKGAYSLGEYGQIYASVGYWDFDTHPVWGDEEEAYGVRTGYKFKIADIDAKVEYRYRDIKYYSSPSDDRSRLRLEANYKF